MPKLRIAILGTGGMGGAHAERFRHHPDVEIAALCDVSLEIIERFIQRMKLGDYQPPPQHFTEPATMFREAGLDAVVIVTPHTLHYDHAMLAAEAGLHVLMEKPMVTSAAQAHALAARFKATGKVFTIGYNTPCTPEFDWLRTAIRNRTFGRLEMVSGYLAQGWMPECVQIVLPLWIVRSVRRSRSFCARTRWCQSGKAGTGSFLSKAAKPCSPWCGTSTRFWAARTASHWLTR